MVVDMRPDPGWERVRMYVNGAVASPDHCEIASIVRRGRYPGTTRPKEDDHPG